MGKILYRTLVVWIGFLIISFGIFISTGGFQEGNVAGFGSIFIVAISFHLAVLWFLSECIFLLYCKISRSFAPLKNSRKHFVILLREDNTIVSYYQKKQEKFRVVFKIENATLKVQNLQSFDNDKKTWNTTFHCPRLTDIQFFTQTICRYYPHLTSVAILNFPSPISLPSRFKDLLLENISDYPSLEKTQKTIIVKETWSLAIISICLILASGYGLYLIFNYDLILIFFSSFF